METHDNFLYLFVALLLLTVVNPMLAASLGDVGGFLAELSLSITLAIALWSMRSSRTFFFVGMALVAVNILGMGAWLLFRNQAANILASVGGLVFLTLAIGLATRQVFRQDRVDLNKLAGALCIYVLIGVAWAIGFQLLEEYQPGSFSGLEPYQGYAFSWRLLYFSFVTLTTLGYGDVLPLTIYAESLTYVEAVLGQFYLTVLVAALVGAYLSDREIRPDPGHAPDGGR
jgi:hypothetical protein